MRLIQCDICDLTIPPSEMNSQIQNRIKNILTSMRDHTEDGNIDVCTACACNLKNSFDDALDKWKESKGNCE